ncbi:MAG: PaRep2b protein [Thermoproteus sp.]
MERLAELFVEAITRVLAWIDAHKAHLFLTAAVAAGLMAASAAMNLWGLIELGALAHAASLAPFAALGGVERSREEALRLIKGAPDPYGKFLEVAKAANAGGIGLAEPWESLRALIAPRPSEERRLVSGKAYGELDERGKRALFYAALALEEAFGIYRAALRRARRLEEAVRRVEVGEPPLKRAVYAADLGRLERLAKEESRAFKDALKVLRERLSEYAVKYDLGGLLNVDEGAARGLAEAERTELSEFSGSNFGVKAYAALLAYREHALGRRGAYGAAARYWLEGGGSAWLLYYAPNTAYNKAKRIKAEGAAAVEEMVAEALRRLFLKPGADYYRGFVKLLEGSGLALRLERETDTSLVFKLLKLEKGGNPVELEGVKLRIEKVGEGEGAGMTYILELDASRRELFEHELKMVWVAAKELRERWPIEDPFPYMLGWSASDVSIRKTKNAKALQMGSSHFWQVAETKALFDWPNVVGLRVSLTLEGPRLIFLVHAPLDKLDGAVRRSEWLKRLGIKVKSWYGFKQVESWDDLKSWAIENWRDVVDAAVRHLGEKARGELEELRDKLKDDKIAREAIAPALLLIQAERLGGDKEAYKDALRYFAAVVSGAVGGDGYVSAAMKEVGLTSGERAVALLWRAAFAAYGIEAEVRGTGSVFQVVTSGDNAVRLARLYFLFGPALLEGNGGDSRLKNHKLAEAVELGAKGPLNIRGKGLRRAESGHVAADLIISEGDIKVKYNAYLHEDKIVLQFQSTDRSRAELAARLLKLAGVSAEVKSKGGEGEWQVRAYTDRLAAGRRELRDAIAEIVREAAENGWVDAGKAERWLDKLKGGLTLREGWPKYYVGLANSGALVVQYHSTNPGNIEREAQRLRAMGLEDGRHFSVKKPEGGGAGYVRILREGLMRAAWLSVHGSGDQQKLAAEFVDYILQRAGEEGREVYKKAEEIVRRGREVDSMRLTDIKGREVDVGGRRHVVTVLGGGAKLEKSWSGRALLRIQIAAEVDGVRGDYEMTYGRRGSDNAAVGYAYASADAPGGREADAERFSALIKVLTGREPRMYRRSDGTVMIKCSEGHLEGFARYAELADAIAKWLEETSRW